MRMVIGLLIKLVLVGMLIYGGICFFFFAKQRDLLYFPQAARGSGERMVLQNAGERLQVSMAGPPDARKALIYFGGNAEDVSLSAADWSSWLPGHRIYLMHYRGFGGSTGKPSEPVLHADARALYDWVKERHAVIEVAGRSLGSGIAVRLAAQQPMARLLLITPYDSIEAVAAHHYGFLPVRWLLKDRFDSAALAPGIRLPTLVVMAEEDDVIPAIRTEALVQRFAPSTVTLIRIPGAGHGNVQASPAFAEALGRFFQP